MDVEYLENLNSTKLNNTNGWHQSINQQTNFMRKINNANKKQNMKHIKSNKKLKKTMKCKSINNKLK